MYLVRIFQIVTCLLPFISTLPTHAEGLPVAELKRDKPVDFATEVYPFLKANCLACHNNTKAKADLILESPEDMLKGGDSGPAIEPGDPDFSLVFTTAAHIEDPIMPPANNKSKAHDLNPTELALLKQWIKEGAKGGRVMTAAPKKWQLLSRDQPLLASAVSASGRYVAAARGQYIDIYDLPRNKLVASLRDPSLEHPVAHQGRVQSLAFHPGEAMLASGGYRIAKVWKRPDEKAEFLAELPADISTTEISPDKTQFAVGLANGTVAIYTLAKADKPVFEKPTYKGKVTAVAFSPDRKFLYTTGEDKKFHKIDTSAPELPPVSVDLTENPAAVEIFHAGKNLLVASGEELQVFNTDLSPVATHKQRAVITHLSLAKDLFITLQSGETDQLQFDTEDLKKAPQKIRTYAHGTPVAGVAATDRYFASHGKSGAIKVWNLADGKLLHQLNRDGRSDEEYAELGIQENIARRLETHWKKQIPIEQELSTAEATKTVEAAEEIAKARRDLAAKKSKGKNPESISEAKRLLDRFVRGRETSARLAGEALTRKLAAESAAAEAAALLKALDAEKKALQEEQSKQRTAFAATGIAFSPDGSILTAALKDGGLRSWAVDKGTWLENADNSSIAAISYINGNTLIATTSKNKLSKLTLPGDSWELEKTIGDGSATEPFSGHVKAIAFDPDGEYLAAASGIPSRSGELLVFDTEKFELTAGNREAHRDSIYSIAFSPDGKHIVSGGADKIVKTFETTTLQNSQSFEGHSDHILDVAWQSDGLFLISGAADTEVKYWNLAANQVERSITTFKNEVVAVAIARGSDGLLTADGAGKLTFANGNLSGAAPTFLHTAEFSENSSIFVTGGKDSVLTIWDGRTRKVITKFPAPAE